MIEFLIEFNVIMLAVVAGLFVAFGVVAHSATSKLKEERDEAIAECDRLRLELEQVKSSGADLAQRIGWRKRKLMNKPEAHLFRELEVLVRRGAHGHRLCPQVSFGSFLEPTARADLEKTKKAAYFAVQRKVADYLIIDKFGQPIVAIEYQGTGHYLGNAHDRDHAKRVACQMAGLPLVEVPATGLTDGQRLDLSRLLGTIQQLAAE